MAFQFSAPSKVVLLAVQVQTERLGDVHHFAWRACHRNQTVYINERDGERFGDWEPHQCAVRALHNEIMKLCRAA